MFNPVKLSVCCVIKITDSFNTGNYQTRKFLYRLKSNCFRNVPKIIVAYVEPAVKPESTISCSLFITGLFNDAVSKSDYLLLANDTMI